MDAELNNLKRKVDLYHEVLKNTKAYRKVWEEELSQKILDQLNYIIGQVELDAQVEVRSELENLEAIDLSLGTVRSGMFQRVNETIQRDLIKHNGSLVYQQLFNGKILVLIQYPHIEGYGEPRPPKTIAIYRPEELKDPYFIRHVEEFLQEITLWEDYDDEEPYQRIGFQLNFGQQGEE
ncbi:hypothetical protein [Lewinella sp. LCG006]|uniref:hypothetical protein n=1 Tax=Lewinella sp. LCG006 TaxID=3231911 RepID=UPI0034601550